MCLACGVIGSRDERRKRKKSARSRKRRSGLYRAIKVTNLASLGHARKWYLNDGPRILISVPVERRNSRREISRRTVLVSKYGSTNLSRLLSCQSPTCAANLSFFFISKNPFLCVFFIRRKYISHLALVKIDRRKRNRDFTVYRILIDFSIRLLREPWWHLFTEVWKCIVTERKDSRDSAMSLIRDGHHPGKNARPRESFPRNVYPVAIRANDTLSAQPGEGRKAKKKKY